MKSKSYGEVLWESFPAACVEDEKHEHPWGFCHQKEWGEAAEAVIKEFCERCWGAGVVIEYSPTKTQDEPVAFVDKDRYGQTYGVLKKELPQWTDLFLSPQPKGRRLPSEEELKDLLTRAYYDRNSFEETVTDILNLLKEKNKDE